MSRIKEVYLLNATRNVNLRRSSSCLFFRTMDSAETKWFALMLGNVGEWSHDVEKLLRP